MGVYAVEQGELSTVMDEAYPLQVVVFYFSYSLESKESEKE